MKSNARKKSVVAKMVSACTALSLLISSFSGVASAANSPNMLPTTEVRQQQVPTEEQVDSEINQLSEKAEVLEIIEKIPDHVINQGSGAIIDWIHTNTDVQLPQNKPSLTTDGVGECVSVVGAALVTLVWTPAKLAQIKSAFKAVGGVKTFVTKLLETYKIARRDLGESRRSAIKMGIQDAARKASLEVRDALLDLFLLGAVYSACFE